jgi:GT2 family glycosyltransferase
MISIVIPNYNGKHHLKDCFDSLIAQTYKDFEIILVDNNSKDGSIEFTMQNYPQVMILPMRYNTGFAKAVNEGIKHATGEYVLLLNNDTECEKNFLNEMLKGFKTEDIGCVACKMINFYDRTKIDDAGDFIKAKGSPYARGYSETDAKQYDKEEYIFGACAGAAIYKKEIFQTVGYFDEDFFAYYEDVDFSFRMQLEGYKCLYNPKAICYHKRGATSSSTSGFQTMLCEKNLVALRIKNYPTSLLIKWFPFFALVRMKRYYLFWRDHSFSLAVSGFKGFLKGLAEIPKSLKKRKGIQKNKKADTKYIESLFR